MPCLVVLGCAPYMRLICSAPPPKIHHPSRACAAHSENPFSIQVVSAARSTGNDARSIDGEGTVRLVQAAAEAGVGKFTLVSSAGVGSGGFLAGGAGDGNGGGAGTTYSAVLVLSIVLGVEGGGDCITMGMVRPPKLDPCPLQS